MSLSRRTFLKALAATAAASALPPALSALADAPAAAPDEFFIFIHAGGGWDITLWSDPRNEKRGILDPATTTNVDASAIRHWIDAPFEGGTKTFRPLTPSGTPFVLGPGIGNLLDLADRLTIVNGLAMNTVSHPDGAIFSATGRHPVAGRVVASSIDTMMANELGRTSILPTLSVGFPSYYVGSDLDRRVVPLRVGSIDAFARMLTRSEAYETIADRQQVTAILSEEARDLAARSANPDVLQGMAMQYAALSQMASGSLETVFSVPALHKAHPGIHYGGPFSGPAAVSAAFAVEAMSRNLVRCVSFTSSGFDTHTSNYRLHPLALQDLFDLVASLVHTMDKLPHPTRPADKLSDHAHILVLSEFCRTPQLNQAAGRDHYPNNSALVISPRFRHPFVSGKSDLDELLPAPIEGFAAGPRPVAPPDLLATFVHAFGIDPQKYLRDGEVVKALLAT